MTKQIAVWLAGIATLLVGVYVMKLGVDASTSSSDAAFQWVYYGGAAVVIGCAVMIYSKWFLKKPAG